MAPSVCEILVLLLLVPTHCFAQEILHAPENTTVFLNQPAVFTCETRGGITLWRVNGTQRELLLPILPDLVLSGEGTAVQTLTIPARAQYNGTRVQCLSVIYGGPSMESDNVTLTIQGPPLSAVGGLIVTNNASSVTISWTAPFSLDVTGVDPDIWYFVLIYNVTDENNRTAILCTDCINITETHYTFTPDYLSPCHVYNFSVTPLNGAGQGESSPNITDEIKFPEVKVKALDNDRYCEVDFRDEQVHTVSVYNYDTVNFVANNGTNGTVFTLPADGEYNATVKDPMACGTGETKNFTTYDVQEPRAESNDGRKIVVNGTLIGNSYAKGCFVVIQCNVTTEMTFIALKRNGTNQNLSMAISMPSSNYTVYVHDLEKDGLPNIHPANLVPSSVKITDGEEKYKAPESLKNASISRHGSILNVNCTPDESASCVLVYRAHGNYTLNCAENFPVIVDLDPDVNYTFALFRRLNNNYTDERPFLSMFVQEKEDSLQPGTPERAENTSSVVAVTVGVLVSAIVILVVVVVTVSIIAIMLRKRKSVELAESIDRNVTASGTALLMGRIAEDGGMKNEESKEEESKYAVVVTSVSVPRPSLPDVSKVQYQEIDIKTTHKMARSQYAEMGPLPAGRPKPLEMDTKTQCPYVMILPHATTPVNENSNRGPPTVQSVMSLLWGVAGRWKEIAEGLEFDEDMIDEIDTNNDMNEGCLQVCVEIWVFKLQPSWEKLSRALRDLEEVELARQAGNKEPQEQRQVPSRQTSDSSSSGVVADTSSECSDFSGEVVPGVEQTPATNDGNNEDGSRGGKKTMPNDCSSGQGARSVFLPYPALHEEGPTISGSSDEDEDTKCDVGTDATVESGEGEKATIVSGTDLFDFPYKPSLEEFHVLPPLDGNDDPDFAQDPVSTQGSDDDYHSGSISSGRQKSAATMDTAKDVGRDFIAGGVVVVPQQSTGFSGITGPEATDTTRGPFRPPAKEVVNDSLSSCVNESQQSAGRFGLNKAVYPSLGFLLTGAGMLVVGGPYMRRDIFKTAPHDEPSPEPLENLSQPSPEETDSSQPLPPDPTPPQSQHAEVSPLQLQENNPPSLPPPPPPLQSSEIEEKVSMPLKKRQYLDPPGNYREKIMKWLHTGVSRGFHGPDLLVKLFTGGLPIGLSSLLQQPFRHT